MTNVFQNNFFCIFGILNFLAFLYFVIFFFGIFSVFAEFVGDVMFPFGFLSNHCSTPPQATVMQGRPVDVDTVAKFGSM